MAAFLGPDSGLGVTPPADPGSQGQANGATVLNLSPAQQASTGLSRGGVNTPGLFTPLTQAGTYTLEFGVVNIGDALIIAQYTVDLRTCGLAPFGHPEVCDVNRDGVCNIGDALRIAQCSAELISCNFSCLPFSCPP